MKSKTLTCITAMTLFAALATPVQLAAQRQTTHFRHYKLIDIGTFGGPSSYTNTLSLSDRFVFTAPDGFAQVLNQQGTVVGWAETPTPAPEADCWIFFECNVSHAFQWQNGVKIDLGALPGAFSSSAASWISSNGLIAGYSQNGELDPLSGSPELRAVVWDNGQITDLGTLGGNQSFAVAVNNRGQVAGVATNQEHDPFSFVYQITPTRSSKGTQTRTVLWDKGAPHDLGTLGGPDAAGGLVNQHGQVAGISYINSIPNPITGLPPFHPFLWEKGKGMKDLGSFGGAATASVNGLNERGEVVGGTDLPGDQQIHPFLWNGKKLLDLVAPPFGGFGNGEASWVNEAGEVVGLAGIPASCPPGSFVNGPMQQAFLWKNGVMKDLGGLPGRPNSEGDFINSRSQIVGISWDCNFNFAAFLWEKGSMVDLNSLVSSPFFLFFVPYLDDEGKIVALGINPDGHIHAVLLIPCQGDEDCVGAAKDATVTRDSTLTLAQRLAIRRIMAGSHARFAHRFHIPVLNAPKD
jgi:probable HAF family extracellular repeat protein